jgi:hypothetical protein
MIWRSTGQILASFAAAGLTVWFSPLLLSPLGLDEFFFIGQLGLTILVLSVLEALFRRLPEPLSHTAEKP